MTFFVEDEIPEVPEPLLPPTSPGILDEAAAASTTLLEVETLLKVLLPLTEITVVSISCVTLPVLKEAVDDADRVAVSAVAKSFDWLDVGPAFEADDCVVSPKAGVEVTVRPFAEL